MTAALAGPPAAEVVASALAAWARIWDPALADKLRADAWRALELPGNCAVREPSFVGAFVAGMPTPTVPLILHAALGADGSRLREAWLRAAHALGLGLDAATLPPDHLALACEVLAAAVAWGEQPLAAELTRRYLRPWCVAALSRLDDEGLPGQVVRCFQDDLRAVRDLGN